MSREPAEIPAAEPPDVLTCQWDKTFLRALPDTRIDQTAPRAAIAHERCERPRGRIHDGQEPPCARVRARHHELFRRDHRPETEGDQRRDAADPVGGSAPGRAPGARAGLADAVIPVPPGYPVPQRHEEAR
ncbi:hypothetical protein [Streptomyces sp. NPDC058741]|uniref:hypothetical protein n=1 Tax=Streptomyces sp. NPDC058741 TaxID=3346620 RepID=UPI00367AFB4C